MQSHRFAAGEIVLYNESRLPGLTWKAPYLILDCIDAKSAEPSYRIRSAHRSQERIAGEHELCRMPQPVPVFQRIQTRLCVDSFDGEAANLNHLAQARRSAMSERVGSRLGGLHV